MAVPGAGASAGSRVVSRRVHRLRLARKIPNHHRLVQNETFQWDQTIAIPLAEETFLKERLPEDRNDAQTTPKQKDQTLLSSG